MTTKFQRYPGKRWALLYGGESEIARFAVAELQRAAQDFFPYVLEVRPVAEADEAFLRAHHLLLCGTEADHPGISRLVAAGTISIPEKSESYVLHSGVSPWNAESRLVALAGADANGMLYAVEDFNARILTAGILPEIPARRREAFDHLPPFHHVESPAIGARGLWTWGYVIYDYRGFFDNMARLRLNMVTIWNDCLPVNCREVIGYACSRGVRVVLGFSWGWGEKVDISCVGDREKIRGRVVAEYLNHYHGLPIDGLYLQTDTEHSIASRQGRPTAHWACLLVNEVGGALLERNPELKIQFGLHATSIQNDYRELEALDPRITITWEDAGMIPYAYEPILSWNEKETEPPDREVGRWLRSAVGTPEATLAHSRKLATLRDASSFAMVPKGWIAIRWPEEFENHGSFLLGERSQRFIRARLRERQPRWDRMNRLWMRRFPLAQTFYRELLKVQPNLLVTALVEDGLFESVIQPSVALFAQTVWNPQRSSDEILDAALSLTGRE